MPSCIDRCRPLWEVAILRITARWALGARGRENFRERGRGLRRRSLVTNSLRAAMFNSRRAPGPGPQRVELEFWGCGKKHISVLVRVKSHPHPSSTAGPRAIFESG